MEISYAFFAEAAQITSDGRLNILGADLHTFQFSGGPPWTLGMMFLVVSTRFPREDCGHLYHFTADLIAPDGNRIEPHIENAFVAPVPEREDAIGKMTIVLQLTGVTLPAPGVYFMHIQVADRERNVAQEKRLRLRVTEASEAVPQQQPA
jgi:hypothetical protein